jgi:hypothetical protein
MDLYKGIPIYNKLGKCYMPHLRATSCSNGSSAIIFKAYDLIDIYAKLAEGST